MSERTYAGIPEEFGKYENSKVVLYPVPYDGTSTWGKGADLGPEAFLTASENMELYDLESNTEVYKHGVFLEKTPDCSFTPEQMVETVKKKTLEVLNSGKIFTMVGGEHSVSIGATMAAAEKYHEISILQLDAHSDLRPEYLGTAYNHACALHWASKYTNLVQVGIRSMDVVEKPFVNNDKIFYAEDIACRNDWQQEVIDKLGDKVYLTIDLDYFDPSIMPSTGT
ncbi:MAG: arginase family protein, partial [Bacteroidales bacterium]|nr:arginase family protein [Bacteroidales bacterium]